MEEPQKVSTERMEATALDVEFLPLLLLHKIHRNLKSSQVEIVAVPYYYREPTPEPEPEPEMQGEPEIPPPAVVYAPPLPALKEKKNWWDFVRPIYAFNNPVIRSRIEKLMSNNIVHVTDRKYMIRLQERIKEDHLEKLHKRIRGREAEEIEREKNLMLEGKIPFEKAPAELKNHPVCRINELARKIMEDKKTKMKTLDKTWAYKTSMQRIRAAEKAKRETVFEKEVEEEDLKQVSAVCVVDADLDEDITRGLMYSQGDYDRLKYEDPFVKVLRDTEVVQDMYEVADKIVGPLKSSAKK